MELATAAALIIVSLSLLWVFFELLTFAKFTVILLKLVCRFSSHIVEGFHAKKLNTVMHWSDSLGKSSLCKSQRTRAVTSLIKPNNSAQYPWRHSLSDQSLIKKKKLKLATFTPGRTQIARAMTSEPLPNDTARLSWRHSTRRPITSRKAAATQQLDVEVHASSSWTCVGEGARAVPPSGCVSHTLRKPRNYKYPI